MYCTNYVRVEDTVILLYSGSKILKGHNLETVLATGNSAVAITMSTMSYMLKLII